MPVNRDKPDRWKDDIAQSVDLYNNWFLKFAPRAFRDARAGSTRAVVATLKATKNLTHVEPAVLRVNPGAIPTLRMCTCPPLARERLVGLAGLPKSMVDRMEKEEQLPVRLAGAELDGELRKIGEIVQKLADRDIFPWFETKSEPAEAEILRAASIVADRLCGATADPIIRNAQEARQLGRIGEWLKARGYELLPPGGEIPFNRMHPGTYAFRMNIPAKLIGGKAVNVPVDVVVMPKKSIGGELPLMLEAKSAGDFTNVNKRRKEEAQKIARLRYTYGSKVRYALFLCGYFDSGYLGYEAADGIDWVWEHRIEDLRLLGL